MQTSPITFLDLFPNAHAARRRLNSPKWTPPLGPNDPSFPSTPLQDVYIVREIHAALADPGPFWRGAHISYRQCGMLKVPRVLQTGDGGLEEGWLEAVAWEALETMKRLYREGFTGPFDPTNHVSPDRRLSFYDRLRALCELLRDWKCACDMMAGPSQDYACVALPLSFRKAFEHQAHAELVRAQHLAAPDPSLTNALAELAKYAAECGLFRLSTPAFARSDLGEFKVDVALVDAGGFDAFIQKQRGVFTVVPQGMTIDVDDALREIENLPPAKRRKTGA